jgi:putative spermidine/putrescine transport system ATP-binding protein
MIAPVIEIEGVGFTYPGSGAGVFDINLTIHAGELLAVIGPSGCGKSTLLRLIAGFLFASRGIIRIGGKDVSGVPPRERDLGIVFQNYALFPHMSALENTAYPLKVRGVSSAERRKRAAETLEMVGLGAVLDSVPAGLSGGQQQRVALARALVFRPRALLLDEPLSALDAALRVEMRDEIRRIQREFNIATLHITHDQQEALSMADRVAVMRQGRIDQVAPPRELYERPATREVAAFVGQANLWPGTVTSSTSIDSPIGPIATRPHDFAPGARVSVMVRPEKVELGASQDGVNTFEGELRRDRFLGSVRRFDISVSGGVIIGETDESEPISAVHIPRHQVHLLPEENIPTAKPGGMR